MSRANLIVKLFEDFVGRQAVTYHRTKKEGMEALRQGQVFQIGGGIMYGPGVYMTYDIQSQFNDRMANTYGEYIIKSRVYLDKYLIFDKDVAAKHYGPQNTTVEAQLKNVFSLDPKNLYQTKFKSDEAYEVIQRGDSSKGPYTSDFAYIFTNEFEWLREKYLRGIVFTGRGDGKVIVAYDNRTVTPISYAHAPVGQLRPIFHPVSEYAKETMGRGTRPYLDTEDEEYASRGRNSIKGFFNIAKRWLQELNRQGLSISQGDIKLRNPGRFDMNGVPTEFRILELVSKIENIDHVEQVFYNVTNRFFKPVKIKHIASREGYRSLYYEIDAMSLYKAEVRYGDTFMVKIDGNKIDTKAKQNYQYY